MCKYNGPSGPLSNCSLSFHDNLITSQTTILSRTITSMLKSSVITLVLTHSVGYSLIIKAVKIILPQRRSVGKT